MINRISVASCVAVLVLTTATAAWAGTRGYDIGSLLFEDHPFASRAPLPPVVAQPAPPVQAHSPTSSYQTMPSQPLAPPRVQAPVTRAAPPPTYRQSPPPAPQAPQVSEVPRKEAPKILSEIRLGLMVHDIGPFSSNEEDGYNGNVELLFVSPDFLDIIWSPRPHVGASVNSAGDTSQIYAGLSWEWSFWGNFFAGFSLGGSINNGKLKTDRVDRKELGCRLLFRESAEIGYRFGGRHSISGMLDHISNANICDKNEGIDTVGVRYGYSF